MSTNPKVRVAGTAAVTLLLGLATGFVISQQMGGGKDSVELSIPGSMSITVFCDKTTVNTEGTVIRFVARDTECEVEAALSAVMPLRGQLSVTAPGRYKCSREGIDLACRGPM